MEYAQESMEQMMKDSDRIFTTISTANYLDKSFSRSGISHALSRLKLFYKKD